MDAEQRLRLAEISNISRNKKLTGILEESEKFVRKSIIWLMISSQTNHLKNQVKMLL